MKAVGYGAAGASLTLTGGVAIEQRVATQWTVGTALGVTFTRTNGPGSQARYNDGTLEPFVRRYLGAAPFDGVFVGAALPITVSYQVDSFQEVTRIGAALALDLGYSLRLGHGIVAQAVVGPVIHGIWSHTHSDALGVGLVGGGLGGVAGIPGAGATTFDAFTWSGGIRTALLLGYSF